MNFRQDAKLYEQLKQVSNMSSFMSWLEARLDEYKDALIANSGDGILRAQGRAMEVKELISTIKNSVK